MSKSPKVLSPEEVEYFKKKRPPLPSRILEIEGGYSLDELKAIAQRHGLSPTGDKERLVVSLIRAGVIEG